MLKKCRGSYARFYCSQVLAIYDGIIFEITRKNILPATPIRELASKFGRTSGFCRLCIGCPHFGRYRQPPTSDIFFLTIIGNGTTLGKEPVNLSNNEGNSTTAPIHRTALLMLFGGTACRAAKILICISNSAMTSEPNYKMKLRNRGMETRNSKYFKKLIRVIEQY
jgi:hypothetical protein